MTRWRHPHTIAHLCAVIVAELAVYVWWVLR